MNWWTWHAAAASNRAGSAYVARLRAWVAGAFLLAAAGSAAQPMEDADYVAIDPGSGSGGNRIEVIEFFYYGCAACDRLEPHLRRWLQALPEDVSFRRVPALRRTEWVPLTRIYFALQELGVLDRLHPEVYKGFHQDHRNLASDSELLDWGEENGLDRTAFAQAIRSDKVAIAVQAARDTTVAYGVRTTPSIVVDGRYLTSAGMVGSVEALLPVVDALIDKVRREHPRP